MSFLHEAPGCAGVELMEVVTLHKLWNGLIFHTEFCLSNTSMSSLYELQEQTGLEK